jgi:hypothetical protein
MDMLYHKKLFTTCEAATGETRRNYTEHGDLDISGWMALKTRESRPDDDTS